MYQEFFGFREKPFNLTPDPKYLYLSQRHTEAFAHLEYGRQQRGGFILITGEVGTGKTTLARYFLSRLDERTATAFVLYPALSAAELLRSTLEDLRIPVTGESLKDHVDALHRFLLAAHAQGREVVLLIDEAQDLSAEVLEQVRLISNLETDTDKLIQIVLMGQSELQELLGRRELRQLAQRVTARYHLEALNRSETEGYIRHRLMVAGGEGKVTFTSGALGAVHRRSGGVPRLVNLICDRALLAAYVVGERVVDTGMVQRAAREVSGAVGWSQRVVFAAGAALVAVATIAWLAFRPTPQVPPTAAAALSPAPRATMPTENAPNPLAPLLLRLQRDASLESAVGAVQARWGPDVALERTPLRTYLDQIRRLDLPVVLEMFHPNKRDTCFLALLQLSGQEAVVSTEAGPVSVSFSDIDKMWTRHAVFLWRDFDGVAGAKGAAIEPWARTALNRAGYTEPDLTKAVGMFQRKVELAPDGVVGIRTLIALYSVGDYQRPRLRTGGVS
ncbi:MAG: AAA family ATPase [Vicinamibacteria bacterium]